MWQRFTTGALLIIFLVVVLIFGGYVFGAAALLVSAICVYEELAVMQKGGHHPVYWPIFTALALCVPLMLFIRPLSIVPILLFTCILVCFSVMRRKEPNLTDVMVSLMPVLTIILPALCLISMVNIQPRPLQAMLMAMVFSVSVGSDVFALFIGTWIGGKKLCPMISPKKTVAGAIGGLFGAVALTALTGYIFTVTNPQLALPPLWANLIVGLIGGIAAEFGDLLASLVKRYCHVKDFGSLFPGHGGMMDRMDSILFASVVIFCYHEVLQFLA